jgi:hypothetical protein
MAMVVDDRAKDFRLVRKEPVECTFRDMAPGNNVLHCCAGISFLQKQIARLTDESISGGPLHFE